MALPTAYVINLDRCPENWTKMLATWEGIFNLKRIPAVDAHVYRISGQSACKQSHFNLLKYLAERDEPYQIVLEDDVYPTAAFKELWPKIQAFLESGKNDWDFIGLDPFVEFEKPQLKIFNPELFIITAFRNTGGLIYRTSFIKENLDSILRIGGGAIDMTFTHKKEYVKLTPQYLIMRQRVDKISQISGSLHVADCNRFYDNTEKYFEEARRILNDS